MCSQRRTFYVLIFLSINKHFGFCQNSLREHLEISSLNVEGENALNGAASDNQINSERVLTSSKRFMHNEITRPLTLESNPPFASFSHGLQVRSTSNKPVSNIRVKSSVFPVFSSQKCDNINPTLNIESCCNLPTAVTSASELSTDTITATPSLTIPHKPGIIETNNFSAGPSSLSADNFQDTSRNHQKPVTLQMPSMPAITPFTALATPFPGMLQQNMPIATYSSSLLSGLYPGSLKTRLNSFTDVGSNIFRTVPEYPIPINLQINLSQPAREPPIILILTPVSPSTSQEYTSLPFMPPMIPPYPMIVKKRSKSAWRSLLPILLITLFDGCRCNDVGCCCAGLSNIPIPYPIPVPTNNPIILNR